MPKAEEGREEIPWLGFGSISCSPNAPWPLVGNGRKE